jgi:hypothetical protein
MSDGHKNYMETIAQTPEKVKQPVEDIPNHVPSEDIQLELFRQSLPAKPYCSDNLSLGLQIAPAIKAIERRYIQPNSPWDLRWLVYDIDRSTALFDWNDARAPAPNIMVLNPDNYHAHFLYGLEVPVYKQPKAHTAPIRYAAAIDVALSVKLQADPGYSGLMCKNPLHPHWQVAVYEGRSYDLDWLADCLDLGPYQDKRKHLPPIGLGRNCTLFEVTRRWAYSRIRREGWRESGFIEAVTEYAGKYNRERFPVPLPWAEVKALGKSVGKWTYRNMSVEGFKAWGDGRRAKSIITRQSKAAERAEAIRTFKAEHPAMSSRMIAEVFEVSHTIINRALNNK